MDGSSFKITDPNLAGGKEINKAAFAVPTGAVQGDLGRNALRGFGATEVDLTLRRQFRLRERLALQLRAGTFNGPSKPAAKGSYVTLYLTGGGETTPSGVTGSITGSSTLKWLAQAATVTVGGIAATVAFDGDAPMFVDGVLQLNIQLSPNTPSGATLPVVLTVGNVSSPSTATLAAHVATPLAESKGLLVLTAHRRRPCEIRNRPRS